MCIYVDHYLVYFDSPIFRKNGQSPIVNHLLPQTPQSLSLHKDLLAPPPPPPPHAPFIQEASD